MAMIREDDRSRLRLITLSAWHDTPPFLFLILFTKNKLKDLVTGILFRTRIARALSSFLWAGRYLPARRTVLRPLPAITASR